MKRAALLLLPFLAACHAPSDTPWQNHGVTVRAIEIHALDAGYADYRIEVRSGKSSYCYGSGAMGGPRERRQQLQQVLELDGYLFTPASCGGGNASKCQGYEVFHADGAKGLTWLGNITGKWDGSQALPYDKGTFYDTGDMLEINDLVSHAASPRFVMAYKASANALVFDAAQTWTLNQEQFNASQDDAPGLLFRAGLAKLCGKSAELNAAQSKADKVLSTLGRQLFAKSLGRVKTSNIQPNAFIPVGQCPPEEKS